MYVLERSQVVPAPRADVFHFFQDPYNLARITPRWLGFRIVRIEGGPPLRAGSTIEYRIRWLGISRTWRTVIAEYEAERRFVDVQERGPYRYWRHEHTFEEFGSQTVMGDRVEYELPFGVAGRLAHLVVVRRQLRGIFAYRERRIKTIFPSRSAS